MYPVTEAQQSIYAATECNRVCILRQTMYIPQERLQEASGYRPRGFRMVILDVRIQKPPVFLSKSTIRLDSELVVKIKLIVVVGVENLLRRFVGGVVCRVAAEYSRKYVFVRPGHDTNKQFCPACGNATMMRVSMWIQADGRVTYRSTHTSHIQTRCVTTHILRIQIYCARASLSTPLLAPSSCIQHSLRRHTLPPTSVPRCFLPAASKTL